ncbi:MAG: CBM96 family carbohydrate-binding protein [Polyangiales bacterium]
MRVALVLALSAITAIAAPASAAGYIDDPLTAPTFAGRGSSGGSFDASGWTTSGPTDTVWYEIPDALPTGKLEIDVTGLSVGGSLVGADHDLLAIYQAPTGKAEPIDYSPWFRNNDFKAFLRIFGSAEVGRGGAMKLELALCPRGDPWYHDEACPASCDKGDLAYAGGSPTDVGWDATKTYRLGIAWGSGKAVISRDGVDLATLPYDGTYAPKPVRVRIGSPRHGISDVAFMPKGITFKNLIVTGEPGTMTPACGAVVETDAGATDAGASVLEALADVTVDDSVTGVFPDTTDLAVEAATGTPSEIVFLRFPDPSGWVKQATLKLHTAAFASATGGSGTVHPVSDGSWSETTLTWATKPSWAPESFGAPKTVDPDQDVEVDVTSMVQSGVRNFAIVSNDPNGAHYLSKEAPGGKGPKLVVEYGTPPPDAGAADASDTDASIATDGSLGLDGGKGVDDDVVRDDGVEGSCGCRLPRARASASPLLFLLGIAVLRRLLTFVQ